MKKHLVLALGALAFSGCAKKDSADENGPATVTAAIGQDFSLSYQQKARVPALGSPELTLTVTELQYAFCPKNMLCIVADFVAPTLSIADAQGQTQVLTLPRTPNRVSSAAWIDTTSIRANSRRYLITYVRWDIANGAWNAPGGPGYPAKGDISVVLRVTKR
ncbi:MAG: hypothetical protein JWR44_2401 [Hymenobacter sp.]|jgi:hypothetical protein|nr:hypothetical protein [Hymenobacter sp.]